MKYFFIILISHIAVNAAEIPSKFVQLVQYNQPPPNQGDTATCLYVATTGAVELLLNQKYDIKNPSPLDRFDISERYALSAEGSSYNYWHEMVVPRFNSGWAIHQSVFPFEAYTQNGSTNSEVWNRPWNFYSLERMEITEKFETTKLFVRGGKYAKYVIKPEDIQAVKEALLKYNAPVLINYNDEGWWHAVLIIGYDDNAQGECYYTPEKECTGAGAFIVRDSDAIGMKSVYRHYDWFRVNANAAFVISIQ